MVSTRSGPSAPTPRAVDVHPIFAIHRRHGQVSEADAVAAVAAFRASAAASSDTARRSVRGKSAHGAALAAAHAQASERVLAAFSWMLWYHAKRWARDDIDGAMSAGMLAVYETCADASIPLEWELLVAKVSSAVTHAIQRDQRAMLAVPPNRHHETIRRVADRVRAETSGGPLSERERLACALPGVGLPTLDDAVQDLGGAVAFELVETLIGETDGRVDDGHVTSPQFAGLYAALHELSPGDRCLLAAAEGLEGAVQLTVLELAAREGVPAATLRRRLSRARERLKGILERRAAEADDARAALASALASTLAPAMAPDPAVCRLSPGRMDRVTFARERAASQARLLPQLTTALQAEAAAAQWDRATTEKVARRVAEYRTGRKAGPFAEALVHALTEAPVVLPTVESVGPTSPDGVVASVDSRTGHEWQLGIFPGDAPVLVG
jgi:hypothetical protein